MGEGDGDERERSGAWGDGGEGVAPENGWADGVREFVDTRPDSNLQIMSGLDKLPLTEVLGGGGVVGGRGHLMRSFRV